VRDLSWETTPGRSVDAAADAVVVRRSEHGWRVGDNQTADLTSAMVLADLLAADLGVPAPALGPHAGTPGPRRSTPASEEDEAARLAVTVAQLEHALAARVRVEQAIGVLAERHRLQPRQAFDLLRSVARSAGRRVTEVAENVVDSASNPLLPLPEELARKQAPPRRRARGVRGARGVWGDGSLPRGVRGDGSPREKQRGV
jgi:ANTAR domain